jgi:hypothetical protein
VPLAPYKYVDMRPTTLCVCSSITLRIKHIQLRKNTKIWCV